MKKRFRHIYQFLFIQHRYKTIVGLAILLIAYWFCLPNPLFNDPTSLVLEDKDKNLLGAKIAKDGQWRFPQIEAVPPKFEQAILEFEDRRFYYHIGIDPISIGRAIVQNIRNGSVVSGGSTLSMQVIRMARKGKPRSLWQKLIESIMATRMELGYSKKEILELYASHAPFGGNVVGLDAASWRYFGKSPNLLSWGEAATLAVLPNAPALIHPGRNREALFNKRNRLLDRLLKQEVIDSLTCELAKTEPLPEKPLPLPRLAPHLLDRANLEYKNQNTRIRSTIDKNLQAQVNQIMQRHHVQLSNNGIHNMAVLVLDVETGNVVTYIGNVLNQYSGEKGEHGEEVDIIQAPRSTGSVIKPLLYALMHNEGQMLPSALVPDIPTQMLNYRPKNFNLKYDGVVSSKTALARSLNIPFIRMLQSYGLEKFHFNIKKLGLSTIKKPAKHYGLPIILGGAEATLWDVTSIYASMSRTLNHFYPNDGWYVQGDFFKPNYLLDKSNKKDSPKLVEEPPLLSAASIYTTFEAMLEVERPTEDGAWELYQSKRRVAWKTGTSFGFRDAWAVGVTPKYAVGVWVGNADGEGRAGLVGLRAAAPVLFDVFDLLPSVRWFDPPYDEMAQIPICKKSGHLHLDICGQPDTVWAPITGLRMKSCPYHQTVHLDKNGKERVHGDCESPSEMRHQSWFVLPPVEEFYYKTNNPTYQVLPPYRADCLASIEEQEKPMQLIYPKANIQQIYVPRNLDGTLSRTVFQVAHRQPDATIFWHLDNEYLGSTETFHDFELLPEIGKHTLTLVDDAGFSITKQFEVLGKGD